MARTSLHAKLKSCALAAGVSVSVETIFGAGVQFWSRESFGCPAPSRYTGAPSKVTELTERLERFPALCWGPPHDEASFRCCRKGAAGTCKKRQLTVLSVSCSAAVRARARTRSHSPAPTNPRLIMSLSACGRARSSVAVPLPPTCERRQFGAGCGDRSSMPQVAPFSWLVIRDIRVRCAGLAVSHGSSPAHTHTPLHEV